ncbi:MAG: hypothetical protein FWD24_05790, partial [Treponema sp.]|nr:hypothetical protein [Treponema sp.]
MGSKNLIFIVLLIIVSSLHAQDSAQNSAQNSGFFIETSTRFVQRLTWSPSSHTLHYEVVIERNEGGSFQRALQEFTEDTFIDVSLTPGNYRYRIIPYDLFNRATLSSAWIDFTVYPALQPELSGFTPQFFIIDSGINEYTLEITGNNLVQGSQIQLRRPGSESQILTPNEINLQSDGTKVRLHFNFDQLTPGIYLIHVRNPGGLETSFGDFFIELPRVSQVEVQEVEIVR